MTPEEVHALAVSHGLSHEQAVVATAIAWAESNLRPDAIGDVDLEDDTWGPSVGLYQVRSLRADTGTGKERDVERLGDPSFNTRSMVAISNGGRNWQPWSVWKNGRYLTHIDAVRAAIGQKESPVTPVQIIEAAMAELETAGYAVTFVDGWEDRGTGGSFEPQGFIFHHTATAASAPGDYPSLGIVRDGVDQGGGYWLPGPLSQFGGGRSGRIYVIAAGKANHAGGGGWNGLSGNYSVWGCEFENNGLGEPWPDAQVDAGLALAAALAKHTGFGPEMVCRHAEWSNAGKIDTATAPLNSGPWIRAQVADRLAAAPPEPPAPTEVPDMFIFDGPDGGVFYTDGATWKRGVPGEDALAPFWQGHVPHLGTITRAYFDALPEVDIPDAKQNRLVGALTDYAPELVQPGGCAEDG